MNIVTALWVVWPTPPARRFALTASAAAVTGAAPTNGPAAGQPVAELPRLAPQADMRYSYAFTRKIDIHGFGKDVPSIEFRGKFWVDVTHADSRGFDAIAEDSVDEAARVTNISGARFRFHVDANGGNLALAGAAPESDAERQHAAILKDLLSNWLFASRTDTVGRYTASVKRLENVGPLERYTKQKLAYVDAHDPIPTIARSLHVMEWSPALGLPLSLKGMESTELGTGRLGLASDSEYTVAFERMDHSVPTAATLASLDHVDSLSIAGNTTRVKRGTGRPIPDWSSLVRRIESIASLTSSQQLELFGDVVANLRANGASSMSGLLSLVSPSVLQAGPASAVFKLAVGALATAASPEAQTALVGLYQDPNIQVDGKGTILAAFTTTQAALDADTRGFLANESQTAASQDLANGAAFALGASLQNAPNDAASTKAIAQIQQAWNEESAAGSKFQEMALMDVMGNSGKADFLPTLSGVIGTSTDPTLRAKAVFDLRFIQTPDALTLLDQSLADPMPGVRLAAVNAMQVAPWNTGFVEPLNQCVSSEQVPQIQKACQQALTRQSEASK